MTFRFSLQALLRFQQTYEKRERLRLAVLNAEYARLQGRYQESDEQRSLIFGQLEERLREGTAAGEFQFGAVLVQHAAQQRSRIRRQMMELEPQLRIQTAAYLDSQRKRKILDSLRERQLRAFELDENRREQQRIDDLFSIRRLHQSRG
jgi:flagellar export protein FliJ